MGENNSVLPIPPGGIYTRDLILGSKILTPIGIGIVRRRRPLFHSFPGAYRLILDIVIDVNARDIKTFKLITTEYSVWYTSY